MPQADYYAHGDYNAVCYQCGAKRKASALRRHWQGYYVCPEHWEPRHLQELVRGAQDVQTVPLAQPESDLLRAVPQPLITENSPELWGDPLSYSIVSELNLPLLTE